MVFAACVAFVGVAGAQNPTDSLSVDVEDLGAIGGAGRRIRLISRNVNPQYGLGAILVRVDAMRSSAGQAPYVSYSQNVSLRDIPPSGMKVMEVQIFVPPRRTGETEAGIRVAPMSASYVLVPRSL